MEEMPNVKIRVIYDGKSIELEFPCDCTIDEWVNQFRSILLWATFSYRLIEESLPSMDGSYEENQN